MLQHREVWFVINTPGSRVMAIDELIEGFPTLPNAPHFWVFPNALNALNRLVFPVPLAQPRGWKRYELRVIVEPASGQTSHDFSRFRASCHDGPPRFQPVIRRFTARVCRVKLRKHRISFCGPRSNE